jgi:hypothetical protein
MTQLITEKSSSQFTSFSDAHTPEPDHVWNLRVFTANVPAPQGDVYTHGVRLHALLSRIKDHGLLSEKEREYLPFLQALRSELRQHGVSYFYPEQVLSHPQLGRGRCDVLVDGGLTPQGIGEMKCVAALPDEVRDDDLVQLGRYAAMRSFPKNRLRLWGFISYVSVRDRAIRIFAYSDISPIGRSVLVAAAA